MNERNHLEELVYKFQQLCNIVHLPDITVENVEKLYSLNYTKINKFLEKYLPFAINLMQLENSTARNEGIKEFCNIINIYYSEVQKSIEEYIEIQVNTMKTLAKKDGILESDINLDLDIIKEEK